MSKTKTAAALIAAGAMAAALSMATTAQADDPMPADGMEACYGVAKAGKNDCGAGRADATCAGSSTVDADPAAWIMVAEGLCDKLVGGSSSKPA